MVNVVTLVGNVVSDPEVRSVSGGRFKLSFPIAVNRKFKGGEQTSFFDVKVWGSDVSVLEEYLYKGRQVCIEAGELEQEKWQNENGEKRSRVVVTCHNPAKIRFLGPGRRDDSEPPATGGDTEASADEPAESEEEVATLF